MAERVEFVVLPAEEDFFERAALAGFSTLMHHIDKGEKIADVAKVAFDGAAAMVMQRRKFIKR